MNPAKRLINWLLKPSNEPVYMLRTKAEELIASSNGEWVKSNRKHRWPCDDWIYIERKNKPTNP